MNELMNESVTMVFVEQPGLHRRQDYEENCLILPPSNVFEKVKSV